MNVDFPAPGAPLMPDADRAAGRGQQLVEQRDRFVAVIGARRLHERDRARERAPIAGAHRVGELQLVGVMSPARRSRTNARISDAALRDVAARTEDRARRPASCRNVVVLRRDHAADHDHDVLARPARAAPR